MTGKIQAAGAAMLSVFFGMFAVLYSFSGIISGIWLAIKGEWGLIGYGLCFVFLMPTVWSLANLPAMILLPVLSQFTRSSNKIGVVFVGGLVCLYNTVLVLCWTVGIFFFYKSSMSDATTIPTLLWGFGVVAGPLAYMASKYPRNTGEDFGSVMAVLLANVVYVLLAFFFILGMALPIQLFIIGILGLIEVIVIVTYSVGIMSAQARGYEPEYEEWEEDA